MTKYKIIAWNVNSIRALIDKVDLDDYLKKEKPQIFCMSETKLSCPDLIVKESLRQKIKGFKHRFYSTCTARKGYSGTAIYSKKKPLSHFYGIENKNLDNEGRVITLEYKEFYLVHVYTPNSGQVLQRLDYRVKEWDPAFWKHVERLKIKKPVVVCGDLNCARYEIDIHNPKGNKRTAGFTIEERTEFKKYLNDSKLKLIDTYRFINPTKVEYSYWSYRFKSREKNKGWRIDYFLVSEKLKNKIINSEILTNVMGSDHAPIKLTIKII